MTESSFNFNDCLDLSSEGASSNSPSTKYNNEERVKIIPTLKTITAIGESEVPKNYAKHLWTGYDSIQECYNISFHDNINNELESLKEQARKVNDQGTGAISFNFGGSELQMLGFAPKGTKYEVRDDDLIFLIGNTAKSWAVSVRYLSAGLAEHGYQTLNKKVLSILVNVGRFRGSDNVRLSRIDVCTDFKSEEITKSLKPSLLDGLIAPAKTKAKIFDNLQVFVRKGLIETLTIGVKGSLEISLYDKSKEIKEASGKTWFYKIWGLSEKEAKKDVWRIEVRFWRSFLRNRNIKTFLDFTEYQTELINEAMYTRRLTQVNPDDSNRSRWSYHAIWVIARRELCGNSKEIVKIGRCVTERRQELSKQLSRQVAGTIRSLNILINQGFYNEASNPFIIGLIHRDLSNDEHHAKKVEAIAERYKYIDEAR